MAAGSSGWKVFTRTSSQCYNFSIVSLTLGSDDCPDDIICNITVYADDTTLHSKCDQVSDLWQ